MDDRIKEPITELVDPSDPSDSALSSNPKPRYEELLLKLKESEKKNKDLSDLYGKSVTTLQKVKLKLKQEQELLAQNGNH